MIIILYVVEENMAIERNRLIYVFRLINETLTSLLTQLDILWSVPHLSVILLLCVLSVKTDIFV